MGSRYILIVLDDGLNMDMRKNERFLLHYVWFIYDAIEKPKVSFQIKSMTLVLEEMDSFGVSKWRYQGGSWKIMESINLHDTQSCTSSTC